MRECLSWLALRGYFVLVPRSDLRLIVEMMRTGKGKRGVFWRNNTGVARLKGKGGRPQPVRFGVPGQPDIAGIIHREIPRSPGTLAGYIGIECKSQTGKLSDKQKAYGQLIEELGGTAIVARCHEDLQRAGL